MHEAKLRCITLTTRRERTLRTSQITMTTRLGRRCLRLLPSTCCGGSAPTADAIDTDDCSPALQVDFAGKTAVHPSSGWLPRHCTTEPAESGRPTRQETGSVWPWATPWCIRIWGDHPFFDILNYEMSCWDSRTELVAMI